VPATRDGLAAAAAPASLPPAANFDRIARLYRWLEYLSFGPALLACRTHFLSHSQHCRKALVFGDGDGRFLARLRARNPALHADAIDNSPAMLRLLAHRVAAHPSTAPLILHCIDARTFTPSGSGYDLIVTHFFLDCFSEPEVAALATRLTPHLAPGALWLLSEFAAPSLLSSLLVRSLYFAFRLLTHLRTTQLPQHSAILVASGFTLRRRHLRLGGLLVSELWQFEP
jgi:Methyltransferase domain